MMGRDSTSTLHQSVYSSRDQFLELNMKEDSYKLWILPTWLWLECKIWWGLCSSLLIMISKVWALWMSWRMRTASAIFALWDCPSSLTISQQIALRGNARLEYIVTMKCPLTFSLRTHQQSNNGDGGWNLGNYHRQTRAQSLPNFTFKPKSSR